MIDLSPAFVARHPEAEPNRSAQRFYDLPYQLIERPQQVLVVGAGTGNDVAAALRNGAEHVDAVEIDPVILKIGMDHHPERPYSSSRVSLHVDDARAFFRKTPKKYDLIVFGLLDSLTMLTSYSSVRLDNYVYTVESFREARGLLREGGSVALSFAVYSPFIPDRLYGTLTRAFDAPPRAYQVSPTNYVFFQGRARESTLPSNFREVSQELSARDSSNLVATDHWPFLYLRQRTIPQSVVWVLIPFLCGSAVLLWRSSMLANISTRRHLHLFMLGAGFLLLETKGVTELALLFGSTWVVNAVVIGAFLVMALLANALIMVRRVSLTAAYTGLFGLLGFATVFPYAALGSLPSATKVLLAGLLVGLPVFLSGLIFSQSFRQVSQPSQALGANLLGAVVGGTLENAVTLGGTPILGVLAIALYGLSAFFTRK